MVRCVEVLRQTARRGAFVLVIFFSSVLALVALSYEEIRPPRHGFSTKVELDSAKFVSVQARSASE